jgi:hypothetical protein
LGFRNESKQMTESTQFILNQWHSKAVHICSQTSSPDTVSCLTPCYLLFLRSGGIGGKLDLWWPQACPTGRWYHSLGPSCPDLWLPRKLMDSGNPNWPHSWASGEGRANPPEALHYISWDFLLICCPLGFHSKPADLEPQALLDACVSGFCSSNAMKEPPLPLEMKVADNRECKAM